jgi:peptidoglycan/LPS O-acetylase OafA/YrhL
VSEELDWGPSRPPAAAWAGSLLLLLALGQLGAFGTAMILDSAAFFEAEPERIVSASVMAFFGLQLLAAIGVLRMWRWWRGIAALLCLAGVALQGAALAGPPDPPLLVGINLGLAGLYLIVLTLLVRSRGAHA